jgi:hypothetical protein
VAHELTKHDCDVILRGSQTAVALVQIGEEDAASAALTAIGLMGPKAWFLLMSGLARAIVAHTVDDGRPFDDEEDAPVVLAIRFLRCTRNKDYETAAALFNAAARDDLDTVIDAGYALVEVAARVLPPPVEVSLS